MPIVSLSVPEATLAKFDEASRRRGYTSRSEAFREAMRAFIDDSHWNLGAGRSTLILSVLYEKETTRDALSSLQHGFQEIRTMLHTHIDEVNCLEIIVAEGPSPALRALVQEVRALRGVKQLKFISTASNV